MSRAPSCFVPEITRSSESFFRSGNSNVPITPPASSFGTISWTVTVTAGFCSSICQNVGIMPRYSGILPEWMLRQPIDATLRSGDLKISGAATEMIISGLSAVTASMYSWLFTLAASSSGKPFALARSAIDLPASFARM